MSVNTKNAFFKRLRKRPDEKVLDYRGAEYGFGEHVVRVTLGVDTYRAYYEVQIGGNCHGFSVIDTAVEDIYDQLMKIENEKNPQEGTDDDEDEDYEDERRYLAIELKDAKGDTLIVEKDEEGYDWIKGMVVAAEIISYKKEKR